MEIALASKRKGNANAVSFRDDEGKWWVVCEKRFSRLLKSFLQASNLGCLGKDGSFECINGGVLGRTGDFRRLSVVAMLFVSFWAQAQRRG